MEEKSFGLAVGLQRQTETADACGMCSEGGSAPQYADREERSRQSHSAAPLQSADSLGKAEDRLQSMPASVLPQSGKDTESAVRDTPPLRGTDELPSDGGKERLSRVPLNVKKKRSMWTAKGLAKTAMLAALAFVVTFLEFPIFPAVPFLQLDFANVFILIGGFTYGPVAAVIVSLIKECLCLFKSSTAGVGEIANFLVTFSFVIVPVLVYRYKKGIRPVVFSLICGCILQICMGLLSNRFINYPLFMGEGTVAAFRAQWGFIAAFNLIKGVSVSLFTILLYKKISWLLNKI